MAIALDREQGLVSGTLRDEGTALLQREEAALRRVILRYVHDPATADDLLQEVGIKVLRRLDTVRDQATLRGWLFQIARNACLDFLRAQDRRPGRSPVEAADDQPTGDAARNPVDLLLSQERISAVHRAIDELPESQRTVILLRLREGLDHLAISRRLGISRQAVEVRLCRGRSALRERLEEILGGDL